MTLKKKTLLLLSTTINCNDIFGTEELAAEKIDKQYRAELIVFIKRILQPKITIRQEINDYLKEQGSEERFN